MFGIPEINLKEVTIRGDVMIKNLVDNQYHCSKCKSHEFTVIDGFDERKNERSILLCCADCKSTVAKSVLIFGVHSRGRGALKVVFENSDSRLYKWIVFEIHPFVAKIYKQSAFEFIHWRPASQESTEHFWFVSLSVSCYYGIPHGFGGPMEPRLEMYIKERNYKVPQGWKVLLND